MTLGSEFNLDLHDLKPVPNSFFQYIGETSYCLFDSGRSALKAVTRILGSGSILLPEYICESVVSCFPPDRVLFYRLKNNLEIDAGDLLSKINETTAAVYLMHYFGSVQPQDTLSLIRAEKEKTGFLIIEDTTHSLFSQIRTVGDYCVASLRKWFAIPNGGVLYSGKSECLSSYDELPRSTDNDKAYAMMLKTLHLNGQLDCETAYRDIFSACEKKLDRQTEIKKISCFSEFLLSCHDAYDMAEKRKSNLRLLKSGLRNIEIWQLCAFSTDDCPFVFPIRVPDRDDFRRYLAEHHIYCAVHWPFDGCAREKRPLAIALSNDMISLPVDQRYGEKEIGYLASVINAYEGRLKS